MTIKEEWKELGVTVPNDIEICDYCGHPTGWHFRGKGSCLECSCMNVVQEEEP